MLFYTTCKLQVVFLFVNLLSYLTGRYLSFILKLYSIHK